jgi:hypothetical protein
MIVRTGAFIRVERGGRWENVEVERLTPDELAAQFGHRTAAELVNWIAMLCNALRQAEDTLDRIAAECFAENG